MIQVSPSVLAKKMEATLWPPSFWSEWGDLPACFACGRRKPSKYSPVFPLAHAHATGVCGHDSSLPLRFSKKDGGHSMASIFLVGVGRLELPASWSRTKRATSCATPRNSLYIIIICPTLVKRKNTALPLYTLDSVLSYHLAIFYKKVRLKAPFTDNIDNSS